MFYNHVINFVKESRRISNEKLEYTGNVSEMGRYLPREYQGLFVRKSFGMGNWADTTWIGFLYNGQTIQHGIYPVFLYYRKQDTLILSFGISERNTPTVKWPSEVYQKQNIGEYFNTIGTKVRHYNASIIGKVFVGSEIDNIDIAQEDELLDKFISYYKTVMQSMNQYQLDTEFYIHKDVDWSFLNDGFTLSNEDAKKILNHLKIQLPKGSNKPIEILFNNISYSAKVVNVGQQIEARDIYQIRYDGTDLMRAIQLFFSNQYNMVKTFKSDPDNKRVRYKFPDGYKANVIIKATNNPSVFTMEGYKEDEYSLSTAISSFSNDIKNTGLKYSDDLLNRYILSLATKPFVILSGLAGSGKTQLAISFAKWIAKSKEQICVVPVGADWNNKDYLLGYPNALTDKYVSTDALTLIQNASKHEDENLPYFLILDEMNLSYVERYFADFLSAIESREAIPLSEGKEIILPKNLYVVGTINVDETTYMFSPKVLDRANVIEFRVQEEEMAEFLNNLISINKSSLDYAGQKYSSIFVKTSKGKDITTNTEAATTLSRFFNELKKVNAEFGYRTASEMFRFITVGKSIDKDTTWLIDAAIVQKLLPKLHGSRKKVEAVLKTLWSFCLADGVNTQLDAITSFNANDLKYKLAGDKIYRMYKTAIDNGFTSFAEA